MTMFKFLHWCAGRMTITGILLGRFGEWLWERGGNLECWCDERAALKRWREWEKSNPGVTVHIIPAAEAFARWSPSDLGMPEYDPSKLTVVTPRQWPNEEQDDGNLL